MAGFETYSQEDKLPITPEARRKKKLWRNLFILNLCISILLVGLFWLPIKLATLNQFTSSLSVNIPKETDNATAMETSMAVQPVNSNLLEPRNATINASSDKEWAYFDFSRGRQVKIFDKTSLEWDLAFRRGKIISNGGATNKYGKAGILDLGEVGFNSVDHAPLNNYVEDVFTRTDTENPALLKWYKYNYFTHKLTAKKRIYSIRTADNKYAKVQFIGFYCENEQAGCIQIKYVYQDSPTNSFQKDAGQKPWEENSTSKDQFS